MRKKAYGLLLAVWLLASSIVPVWGAGSATLTITPDITEAAAGKDAVEIVYTITVTPPTGESVGVFSFQLRPSAQMTLPAAFTENGKTVISYAQSGLKYSAATGKGVFSTYEYTPAAAFFAAVGSTAERRMTKAAEIMTIHATVPAGVSGAFVLDADFTVAPDGSGLTYDAVVDCPPVIISAPDNPATANSSAQPHTGAVAVTGLTAPVAGQTPDTTVTVTSSLPAPLWASLVWERDGVGMSDATFEAGRVYTAVVLVTVSGDGIFDETVAANNGFTVIRTNDTHLELRRSFRVEEHYTEAVKPENATPGTVTPENAPQADTLPNSADAQMDETPTASQREHAKGGLAALVALAGLAVALGAVQLFVPGGVTALWRRNKRKSTHKSEEGKRGDGDD